MTRLRQRVVSPTRSENSISGVITACLRSVRGAHHLPPGLPPDPLADDPVGRTGGSLASPRSTRAGWPSRPTWSDLAVYEALLAHKEFGSVLRRVPARPIINDWDMLFQSVAIQAIDGTVRLHEPAHDPEPDLYVTWD